MSNTINRSSWCVAPTSPLLHSRSSGMNGPSFRGEFTCQGRVQERVHLSQILFAHGSCGEKNVTFMATSLEPLVSSFTSFDKTVITKTMAPLLVCMFLTLLCEHSEKGQCVPPRSCAVSWQVPHRLCPWWPPRDTRALAAPLPEPCALRPSVPHGGEPRAPSLHVRSVWETKPAVWRPLSTRPPAGTPGAPLEEGPGAAAAVGAAPLGVSRVALAVNTVARQHLSH